MLRCLFSDGNRLGCLVGLVPEPILWAAGVAFVLFLAGVAWRFQDVLRFVYRIASWPGVAAVAGFITFIIWYLFFRAPELPQKADDGAPIVVERKPLFPRGASNEPGSGRRVLFPNAPWNKGRS